jgi:MoaA/NifB/PqqE/SkfB family radical SAM enzyme
LTGQTLLSFEQWLEIFRQADELGTTSLTISGGEPTLYRKLPELVRAGKDLGWRVKLNSNGSLLKPRLAGTLLDAGLDAVDISIYSPVAALHDHMRGLPGLWQRATAALTLFVKLRQNHPHFQVISQSILTRLNCLQFDQLLGMHLNLEIDGLLVSYLEGDFEGRHLPGPDQLRIFRQEILPKAIKLCSTLPLVTRLALKTRLDSIFSPHLLDPAAWSHGKYQPQHQICGIPRRQALILANGDVYPCNFVEYTHEPVVGDLLRSSLSSIWEGPKWREFRRTKQAFCAWCPMNLHTYLPLTSKGWASGLVQAMLPLLAGNRPKSMVWEDKISRQIARVRKRLKHP